MHDARDVQEGPLDAHNIVLTDVWNPTTATMTTTTAIVCNSQEVLLTPRSAALNSARKGGGGPGMVVRPTQTKSGSAAALPSKRTWIAPSSGPWLRAPGARPSFEPHIQVFTSNAVQAREVPSAICALARSSAPRGLNHGLRMRFNLAQFFLTLCDLRHFVLPCSRAEH